MAYALLMTIMRYVNLRVAVVLLFSLIAALLFQLPGSQQWLSLNTGKHEEPRWLIATMSAATSQRRRNIIRATIGKAYSNPSFTLRFVISNPGDIWLPVIEHENKTFGDMIVLSHLEETGHLANTIKSVECLKHLVHSGETWRFVSKMDDDSFVALPAFYRHYLEPLLLEEKTITTGSDHAVIGRRLQGERPYPYPGGQFYTLSWGMVSAIVKQYEAYPVEDEDEDVLIGRLLNEAGVNFDVTELENPVAFDYDAENDDKWAWSHNITEESINPHRLKTDIVYLDVAAQMLALHPS